MLSDDKNVRLVRGRKKVCIFINLPLDKSHFITGSSSEQVLQGVSNAAKYIYWDLSEKAKDIIKDLGVGTTITLSHMAKIDGEGTTRASLALTRPDQTGTQYADFPADITTSWKKYTTRIELTHDDVVRYGIGINWTDVKVLIKNVKVELGSVATDWSPAPEDLQDKLTIPLPPEQGGTGNVNDCSIIATINSNGPMLTMTNKTGSGVITLYSYRDKRLQTQYRRPGEGPINTAFIYTTLDKPTPSDIGAQEKPTDGVLVPVYPNAGAHNAVYRGKNIQDKFEDGSLYTAIQNGTFDDLYIGDYFDITISTEYTANEKVRCLLAGFDMYMNRGYPTRLSKHHAVIVPKDCFTAYAKMNPTNDTTGSYAGSDMFVNTLPKYATGLKTVFGDHFIKHMECLGTEMDPTIPSMGGLGRVGATSNHAWVDCELRQMNEIETLGSNVFASSAYDAGSANIQLPLFRLAPDYLVCGNGYGSTNWCYWWLSDVASSAGFSFINFSGIIGNADNATGAIYIRPRWLIG